MRNLSREVFMENRETVMNSFGLSLWGLNNPENVKKRVVKSLQCLDSPHIFECFFIQARIKKIMQTDEDVGKVAAAVPVIICILFKFYHFYFYVNVMSEN